MKNIRRGTAVLAASAVVGLALAGCGAGNSGSSDKAIVVGTTDKVVAIDPAGSYDNGSFNVLNQVYQYLLNIPRAARRHRRLTSPRSADFSSPTEYTVTLKTA